MLDADVDERYYISSNMMNYFMGVNQKPSKFPRRERFLSNINRKNQDIANSVTTCAGQRPTDNFIKMSTELQRKVCDKAIEGGLVMPNDAIEYTYSNARLKEIEEGHIKKQNEADNQIMSTLKTNPQQIGVCVDEPFVVASRGRGEQNVQHLEPRKDGVTNTLTSVQKDNYVATPYRIRKLTPRECYRLMGFSDDDFNKASKEISNTQLYKTAGNSIVVNVLEAILKKLLVERNE